MDPKWTALSSGTSRTKEMYFLLVITFNLLLSLVTCKGSHNSDCNVIPKNVFIEKGSSVKIVCLTSCTLEKVYWKQDNRPDKEHESKRINSSHTVLTLRNFTDRMATLECRKLQTDMVIGGTIIRTYTKPSSLSCMLHYEDQIMATPDLFTCKWEDQTNLYQRINYTVLCTSSSCTPPYEICRSQEKICSKNYNDIMTAIPLMGSLNITVRAKSDYGEVFSDQYQFETLKILKIIQPRLQRLTARSVHLHVEWSIPFRVKYSLYVCQVKHQKAIGEGTGKWLFQNKTLKESWEKEGMEEMTIGGIDSCSNYTVAVRCAVVGAIWSNWSQEKTVLTQLNRNDYKPRLWRTLIKSDRDGVRYVRAMWTEAPAACPDALSYTVKHTPYQERGAHVGVLCRDSVCKISPSAHTISLTVLQNETVFAEDSVYIPAVGDRSLPQITNIQTKSLNGSILVSWRAPLQPVDGYVIDYTHNGEQFTCVETKNTSVMLSGLRDKTPYDITITSLFEDKTGHGNRTTKICSCRGAPSAFNIDNDEPEARCVLLRWTVRSHEVCAGTVVTYLVVYHSDNDGSLLNMTVDGKHQKVLLKSLTPGTSYSVSVEARALNGSTRSNDLTFSTKKYDSLFINVVTALGSAMIILVLFVGVYCVCQWKKFKDKPVPDPAHSSVAKWLPKHDERELQPAQPFHRPSEILPDRVDAEEIQKPTVFPPDKKGGYENLICEQVEECPFPNDTSSPNQHNQCEINSQQTDQDLPEMLSSESCLLNPYRTQSPVETPAVKMAKQFRLIPVKQREGTSQTVYVTLDMLEQG